MQPVVVPVDVLQAPLLVDALPLEVRPNDCADCGRVSFASLVYGLDGMVLVFSVELDRREPNIDNVGA